MMFLSACSRETHPITLKNLEGRKPTGPVRKKRQHLCHVLALPTPQGGLPLEHGSGHTELMTSLPTPLGT